MNPNSYFRRFYLILWKNWLLRKRRYILTFLEIIIPTFFSFILIIPSISYRGEIESPKAAENVKTNTVKEYRGKIYSEQNLMKKIPRFGNGFYADGALIAYAPNNPKTTAVIMSLIKDTRNTFDDTEGNRTGLKAMGFANESAIEMYYTNQKVEEQQEEQRRFKETGDALPTRPTLPRISAAIVFEKGLSDSSVDSKISYKIRIPFDDRFSSSEESSEGIRRTDSFFNRLKRTANEDNRRRRFGRFIDDDEDSVDSYIEYGFTLLQVKLDKILIRRFINTPVDISMNVQEMPYPSFEKDLRRLGFEEVFPGGGSELLLFGFMFIVPSIVLNVVSEKQSGIKELMKMMGLPNWMHWLAWMVNAMCLHMITVTIIIILICGIGQGPISIVPLSHFSILWVSLCLYLMSATAFLFFISVFFRIPILANIVAIVLWIATYFGTTVPIDNDMLKRDFSIYDRMAVALLPNYAFALLFKAVFGLETKNVGAQWKYLFEPMNRLDPLTIAHSWFMFIVDTILYMSLTIYVENIIPSEYGVRKPWYYLFLPSNWGFGVRKSSQVAPAVIEGQDELSGFETEPTDLTAGIVIKNLNKRFGRNKVAVDNISFKMFDGQITILLGHNGAGKTTTMSILTGLFAPSGGTAVINGYDINTQMDYVRTSLGLCPQHNLLFDKLNVEQHLIFFGRVKGLSKSQAKTETNFLLQQIKLEEKRKILSKALSGGQKRKLSLGIALIGGTKVLILDEPTSGMDPEARRAIWDILLAMRGSRTILLTTHFMEEADILGDRIAIMAAGKLQCCGTPAYLKKFFGAGYTLAMTIEENSDKENILLTVQKHIPSAFWKFQKFSNTSEIAITLPTEGESTSTYPAMFTELTENKETLGIRTMGLSLTTMDEVFVKVGERLTGEDNTTIELAPNEDQLLNQTHGAYLTPTVPKIRGFRLVGQQFWGLVLKRILYTSRSPLLFLCQLVTPVLLFIAGIQIINTLMNHQGAPGPLTMSLLDYTNPKTLYSGSDNELKMSYPKVVGSSASFVPSNLVDRLLEEGNKDLAAYRARYIIAAQLDPSKLTALHSSIVYHSNPLSVNLLSNAILKSLDPQKDFSIEVTNHPLYDELSNIRFGVFIDFSNRAFISVSFGPIICVGLALFAASFVVFPVEENICKAKQLQYMTGVSPLVFWYSSFLWDFVVMAALVSVLTVCFPIFQTSGSLTVNGSAGVIFLILLIFGFTVIPFAYVASLFLKSVAGAFAFASTVHLMSGLLFPLILLFTEILAARLGWDTLSTFFRILAWLFPNFGATIALTKHIALTLENARCTTIPTKYKTLICSGGPRNPTYPMLYECCDTCRSTSSITCFVPKPYLQWTENITLSKFDEEQISIVGAGQELFYLFLLGVFYHAILVLAEYGIVHKIANALSKSQRTVFALPGEDDVVAESQRVQGMILTGHVSDDALVVGNLCKSYGDFSAVANLSFGVHYGECFGLLGVNGAGKTTTFRMLTGDEIRTSGNAFGFNCTLERNSANFLSNIGYCPQYDGLVGVLKGREILELFGRLRGIPPRQIKSEANKWLTKMGLLEAGNVKCKNYSGGMKRRLSAGVALIGDPRIIMLDEPTSGVDPVSRRHFWKVLADLREQGQSIILTSHSMEECEALCSRLGIMVNGQFQCFGGVQHLKARYAQGFSLFLKLKPLIPVDHPGVLALQGEITVKFEPCALKDQHQNVLHYQLYNYTMPWNVFFQIMEDLRVQFQEFIEDYSVNETTLEEVFLAFARLQYPQRVAKVGGCTKCLTCQCACFS